jgi:5-oxoprolinase (ATP-hydrolysing)
VAERDFRHEIAIDRGGTFTDFVHLDRETAALATLKLPSSEAAPLEGIRRLLGVREGSPIPPCDVRLGTTVATNALLERRGARTALAVSRGFGDLLAIGDQTRPDLFALSIERTPPLAEVVVELDARLDPNGTVLERPDAAALRRVLSSVRERGIESLAIVVLHDQRKGVLENEIAAVARELGFGYVACGHEVSPEIGLLARAETTTLDAYLTPPVRAAMSRLRAELSGSRLRVMQSNGTLTEPAALRGSASLLSGPAGGVVACAKLAERAALGPVIGFDMGGTSTDVCRSAGPLELDAETTVAGVRVRAPVLAVTTIAAGGGSVCRFDGSKLTVGPESAGAVPGPLAYGRPEATELTLSDVNLLLGRLVPERFPLPLERERAARKLAAIAAELGAAGHPLSPEEVGEAFLEIGNRAMAAAIREVSVSRGHDAREHTLLVLGGAGGQHACAVARLSGMTRVVFHPLGGVLAAVGVGLADVGWRGLSEIAEPLGPESLARADAAFDELARRGRESLASQVGEADTTTVTRSLSLRHTGTETSLELAPEPLDALLASFHALHQRLFGYARPEHTVELVSAHVEVSARRRFADVPEVTGPGKPAGVTRLFHDGRFLETVPVLDRASLTAGRCLEGPLVLAETTGTIVIDPGFRVTLEPDGLLVATPSAAVPAPETLRGSRRAAGAAGSERADPMLLEVMSRRFMSIAEQMGRVLRRTALSTNIRERLDFSCAVFDAEGGLVANAPHIPVHLGAMGESVRAVMARHPALERGDVFVTNDPSLGGSHLPDITVVAPVHDPSGRLRFFVANRGHHADVGGTAPGSMPPDSRRIEDEGVVLGALRLVHHGHFDEAELLRVLGAGAHPARRPSDNVADLKAQVAATRLGLELLAELGAEAGFDTVSRYMRHVADDAAERVARFLRSLPAGTRRFEDTLDDGTPVVVTVTVEDGHLDVDFTGTAPEQPTNANAPRAVTTAAVLYCLRAWLGEPIPLNAGCLRHVRITVPGGSLLSPLPGAAVAAGNVETSQRVVDVLLAAAGAAAASQGTMNNLCFGDAAFGYYETIAGGAGAGPGFPGASAVHTHMTNTRLTDPEVLERRYPVRVRELSVRRGSGGTGRFRGGDGLCRELELIAPLRVSMISERRVHVPFGLAGGGPGKPGRNLVNGQEQPGRFSLDLAAGDRIRIETPGGGGYGKAD